MPPKKNKTSVQPVPEKRGYEFGGPYLFPELQLNETKLTIAID